MMKKTALIAASLAAMGMATSPATTTRNAVPVPTQRVASRPRKQKRKNGFDQGVFSRRVGKYSGKDLRKIRLNNGVGGPVDRVNWAQAKQMNDLHDAWHAKKFGGAHA